MSVRVPKYSNGTLTVLSSTFLENLGDEYGGGICSIGTVTVENSTLTENESSRSTAGAGGGIYGEGIVTIKNSTISGNFGLYGGGVFAYGGYLSINSSTINNNSGYYSGGGIWSSATVILNNSIVANSGTGGDIFISGGLLSGTHNIVEDGSGGPGLINTITGDPLLGELAENGGPTWTHAILAGGPAYNAGDSSILTPLEFDQRGLGFDRVVGGRVDIGAYEVQIVLVDSADFDEDGDVDGRDFLAWQRGFGTPAPTAVKSQGDADNDLDVDGADLSVWQLQYGTVPGPLVATLAVEDTIEAEVQFVSAVDDPFSNYQAVLDAAMAWEFLSQSQPEWESPVVEERALQAFFAEAPVEAIAERFSDASQFLGDPVDEESESEASEDPPWLDAELLEKVFG